MSATENTEEQVRAVFEAMRDRNLSNYVGLTASNKARLDGDFSVAELEEVLSQLRRFDTKVWATAGYLEKNFSLSSGGEDVVYVGSRPCAIVIDAEGEEVAYAPMPYATIVQRALNAYDEEQDEFGINVPELSGT